MSNKDKDKVGRVIELLDGDDIKNSQIYVVTTNPDSPNKLNDDFEVTFYNQGEENGGDSTDQDEAEDPWKIQDTVASKGIPWSKLTGKEKVKKVFIGIGKFIALLILLYFFVCSLDLLSLGFRLIGGRTTGEIFRQSEILQNPVVGVMIGILTTVLVQSSSTSTSIIVSMVAAEFLEVKVAIPVIMGANIGTSITNTVVSLTQAGDRNQFRRAFAGATVHDMFNWLTVITLLILEVTTGYLYELTTAVMKSIKPDSASGGEIELLGVITKPFINLIVQLDKNVLECWSKPSCDKHDNSSLIKEFCNPKKAKVFLTPLVSDFSSSTEISVETGTKCKFLFAGTSMSDAAVGAIVLVGSLIVLCVCLILIVKVLNSVLQGQVAVLIKKTLNADIPYVPWITGYLAILVGAVMTFLVQSSSVFTSALTPLVGVGVITVERVYPLTLGSNIGTTTTALIASLAVTGDTFYPSLQVALCHLFFNVTGILIFYPIPFMRFPIGMAKVLGETTAKYRWFAIAYMIAMFVVLPVIVMGLSFAGSIYVIIFAGLLFAIGAFVVLVNYIRKKRPSLLPKVLLSWKWLPAPLRSLEPYDRIFSSLACCRKLKDKSTDATTTTKKVKNSNVTDIEEQSIPRIPRINQNVNDSQGLRGRNSQVGYDNTGFVN